MIFECFYNNYIYVFILIDFINHDVVNDPCFWMILNNFFSYCWLITNFNFVLQFLIYTGCPIKSGHPFLSFNLKEIDYNKYILNLIVQIKQLCEHNVLSKAVWETALWISKQRDV